jgi:hypothetical protein
MRAMCSVGLTLRDLMRSKNYKAPHYELDSSAMFQICDLLLTRETKIRTAYNVERRLEYITWIRGFR